VSEPVEKLQPCLLDRLTDDEPGKNAESRAQRVISMSRYRQGVMRDLEWLFGASAHLPKGLNEFEFNLEDYPDAFKSVINFGTRHLFGLTSPNLRDLQRRLTDALRIYEPRIDPITLKVSVKMDRNILVMDIQGDLWAQEKAEHLHIKTRLDLQGGYCSVGD
jgi:type VI secretion system protein ImpF